MKKKSVNKKYIFRLFIAIITLISVIFLWNYPLFLMVILILISIPFILAFEPKKALKIYIKYGLAGVCAEAIAIFMGVWNYSQPSFAGVPFWLPFLWGIAALFISTSRK